MTTTLPNGTRVPDVASTSWAGDLEVNWQLLDAAIGAIGSNVQTNRPNTWTAEQTFSEPIVGNLTGTASKAGADEDGTSIKTGYGKLAYVNTWATAQVFLNALRFNNTSYVSGTPSENIFYTALQWGGYVNNIWNAPFSINNAIRTNGYSETSFRTYSQTSNTLTGFVHETNADASDIAFRPIVNGTHKLGSSSYQWKSVYAQTYYYNGTAWGLDKANTWTGSNLFNDSINISRLSASGIRIYNNDVDVTANSGQPEMTVSDSQSFISFKTKYPQIFALVDFTLMPTSTYTRLRFATRFFTNSNSLKSVVIDIIVDSSNNKSFAPSTNNEVNLGTSTNKWKTLNGVNPGALSLPDIAQYIDLTANIPSASLDGNTDINLSSYITSSGWLSIVVPDTNTDDFVFVQNGSSLNNRFFMSGARGNGFISLMMPINSAGGVNAKIKASSVTFCKFYPCLGNV